MLEICKWVLYFFIYSFIGWLCEVIYCSIGNRKLVNRGFLYAPICPIYGFGGVFVLLPLFPLRDRWYVVLILGIVITSALEYLTSYIMEKIFKMRWWDYSHYKFNLNGRICLLNSSLFGILVMVMVYLVHPQIIKLVALLPNIAVYILSGGLAIGICIDFIFSCIAAGKFKNVLKTLSEKAAELKEKYAASVAKHRINPILHKFPRIKSIKNAEALQFFKNYTEKMRAQLIEQRLKLAELRHKNKKQKYDNQSNTDTPNDMVK